MQTELQAVDSTRRRRRPRPVLTPFHPLGLQDDMDIEFKTGSQGTTLRKTHLPQPKTKLPLPKPSIASLTAAAFAKGDIIGAQIKSDTPSMNEQHGNIQSKAISSGAEVAQECRSPLQRNIDQVERMTTNKRSTTTNPALLSPLSLPPPSTRPRISSESPSKFRGKGERPLGASSVWLHEPINDIGQDSIRAPPSTTPERSSERSPERSPERKAESGPRSTPERLKTESNLLYTPQSKNKLPSDDSDDNQMTPKPKPRKLLKRTKSSGFQLPDNTEPSSEDVGIWVGYIFLLLLIFEPRLYQKSQTQITHRSSLPPTSEELLLLLRKLIGSDLASAHQKFHPLDSNPPVLMSLNIVPYYR